TSSITTLAPVQTSLSFNVSWSGSDDANGSGIATYNVFVSENGGAFTSFLLGTMQTSATFTGQDGHTYAFYSVAADNVVNLQSIPATPQASPSISIPAVPTSTTLTAITNATTGGTLVTLTATVTPSPGSLGTVTIRDHGIAIDGGSNISLANGAATLQI